MSLNRASHGRRATSQGEVRSTIATRPNTLTLRDRAVRGDGPVEPQVRARLYGALGGLRVATQIAGSRIIKARGSWGWRSPKRTGPSPKWSR